MKTIPQMHTMLFYILIHLSEPALFLLSILNQRPTGLSNFIKSNFFNSHDIWHMVSTGNFKHTFATFSAGYIILEENILKCLGNKMLTKSNLEHYVIT